MSTTVRRTIRQYTAGEIAAPSRYFRSEYASDVPTMNRKNGKMRSVGVQPNHSA